MSCADSHGPRAGSDGSRVECHARFRDVSATAVASDLIVDQYRATTRFSNYLPLQNLRIRSMTEVVLFAFPRL